MALGSLAVDSLYEEGSKQVDTLKCWCKHSNAAALLGDLNITSSTDHATGDYSFNLTNSFTGNDDYSQTGSPNAATGVLAVRNTGRDTASVVGVETYGTGGAAVDYGTNFNCPGVLA